MLRQPPHIKSPSLSLSDTHSPTYLQEEMISLEIDKKDIRSRKGQMGTER